jgi:MFS family permease
MSPGLPTLLLLPLLRCFYLGESYTLHSIRNGFTLSLWSFLKLAVHFVEGRRQWMRLSLDVQLPVQAPLEYTVPSLLANALTIVGVMSIIGSNTSDKERPTYIGLAGAMWGLASVLGPVLGGTYPPYPCPF